MRLQADLMRLKGFFRAIDYYSSLVSAVLASALIAVRNFRLRRVIGPPGALTA